MSKINIPKNILKELYTDQRLSIAKIAKKLNCHPRTVHRKMKQYRVKSRTLSEAATKVLTSKERLRELYNKKGLSTEQIGKLYNCSHATILNKMKIYKIKRRSRLGSRKSVKIPKYVLKNLYGKQKLSQAQIAKKLGYSICAIQKKMQAHNIKPRSYSEANTIYPKYDFGEHLKEKAYLIGFRLGDLSVKRKGSLIHVGCSTTILEQVQLIKNLFSKYTNVYTKESRILNNKQVIDIQCLLNESFNFLLPKEDKVEDWILKNNKLFFAFLAGYIDAEGYIFTRLSNKNSKTPTAGFELQSYDKNILHQIWKKLNSLNIECPKPLISKPKGYTAKSGIKNNNDLWRLSVNKKDSLLVMLTSIESYIRHGKRKKRLKEAKQNIIFRNKFLKKS
jgi:transcriptional regulator with XRE-family HTH domain